MSALVLRRSMLFAAAITACLWTGPVVAEDQAPMLTTDGYPTVDGSTSTQPLGALMACRLTHTAFVWIGEFDGTRRLRPTMCDYDPLERLSLGFSEPGCHAPKNIQFALDARIQHRGTHQSYTNLISGSANLIIVAREPSEDELRMAEDRGVHIRWKPIALDAFVFIVNRNNQVESLTLEQIRAIYTGAIKNWEQVGGASAAINAYQRNRNSGSQEKMEKMVMKGLDMIGPLDLEATINMIGPFNAVLSDHNGLGYTFQYYDTHMMRIPEVKMIAVDGVEPSAKNIRERTYPFVSEVIVAWLDDLPAGSAAEVVRDWMLSDEGQQVVRESGYAPLK